jgi:cytochrome d ubiquinol oxidase subunit I
LFLINFAIGVVTGLTLEFQFGTNWSKYSRYVGDVFGSLLAIEATTSFFLESTFIAVWAFGWNKLSPKAHAVTIWLVALASTLSALWILIANSWMQHPVGYAIRNGRAELTDFLAVVTQKHAVIQFLHTVGAAYILSGFFVMAVSAYHLLRKQHVSFFTRSFRIALSFALVFSIFEVIQGHMNGAHVAEMQPTKLAAIESHWETQTHAPFHLLLIPDEKNERNAVEFGAIPGALSMLAYNSPSAEVKGLKDFPKEERPPVAPVFYAFRIMVALGMFFVLVTVIGWFKRNRLESSPRYLRLVLYSLPLPYLAAELGWMVAEVGRQPWVVYGLMKTADAVSPIAASQVLVSFLAFTLVYTILGVVDFYLLAKYARQGPKAVEAQGAVDWKGGVSHA